MRRGLQGQPPTWGGWLGRHRPRSLKAAMEASRRVWLTRHLRRLCDAAITGDAQGPVPPPLAPMPGLPSLPGGAIPIGLEPPPYSEVTAKPFLYPLPPGPSPERSRAPGAQHLFVTQTSF
ncbi:sine oculis-binding protein homolog isoform X1 [Phalacrocorax carbo]|uniref:sine oculis-binding protein homolog isoform X1 n=1 Tax=Phalacrocorax carbo TaxID=9209 RepID=UPI003119541F